MKQFEKDKELMQQEGSVGGGSKLNTREKENQRAKKMISTESLYPPLLKKKAIIGIIINVSSCSLKSKHTKVHKAITQRGGKQKTKERGSEGTDMTEERRD